MQHFYSTINSLLRFLAFMQHMPNISLMNILWSNLAHGTLNCFSSITHNHLPFYPLLLHLPEKKFPALCIYCYWWNTGEHQRTQRIHDIEIAFSSFLCILLVNSNNSLTLRNLALQVRLSSLTCFMNDCRNCSKTHMFS